MRGMLEKLYRLRLVIPAEEHNEVRVFKRKSLYMDQGTAPVMGQDGSNLMIIVEAFLEVLDPDLQPVADITSSVSGIDL